ncbi:MAG: response regulator [Nitrospinota bacterium]
MADDHVMFRQAISLCLERDAEIEVVGEASDGVEVVVEGARLKPDVVLMDLVMPKLGGLDAVRQLRKQAPGTKVLILSMYSDRESVLKAMRLGVAGYVVKENPETQLREAIRRVAAGGRYLCEEVERVIFDILKDDVRPQPEKEADVLTRREKQVLQLIAKGHSNLKAAEELAISVKTVNAHRYNLMKKLDMHNVQELVRYAIRQGLVSP